MSGKETAGPSTTLRSGRDDKFVWVVGSGTQTELSSRPERSVVEGPAVSFPGHHTRSKAWPLRSYSPRLKANNSPGYPWPPMASTMYCLPLSMYVIGEPVCPDGMYTAPASLPVALS
jgi:hypothetical protein